MIISLIVAVAKNGVIGKSEGGIPWHLPRDSRHFRDYTSGKWMVVGRRTYSEMIGWFKDRTPIVVTRNPEYQAGDSIHTAQSVEAAIEIAQANQVDELVVAGGGELYKAALPLVDKLLITHVDAEILDGSVHFPEIDMQDWQLDRVETWRSDSENQYSMRMEVWFRKRS